MSQNTTTSLSCHDDAWLLLPWYVNQTLSDEDRDLVEDHLRVCVTCRGELNVQRQLQEGIRHSATSELCEHIQLENLIQKIQKSQDDASDGGRPVRKTYRRAGAYAIAASLLLMVALPFSGILPPEARNYNTLSGPQTVSAAGKHDIRVIFSSAVNANGRQQLLSLVNGSIIKAPDSNGVYLVRIDATEEGVSPDTAKVLALLHKQPQIVFAEPVVSAGR